MSYLDAAYRALYGMTTIEKLPLSTRVLQAGEGPASDTVKTRLVEGKLIILSPRTERKLMEEDYGNVSGICSPEILGESRRLFGARVAYDRNLADGQFLVVETFYSTY